MKDSKRLQISKKNSFRNAKMQMWLEKLWKKKRW